MKISLLWSCLLISSFFHQACAEKEETITPDDMIEQVEEVDFAGYALITSVNVSGDAESFQFSVGISSPDTGCDQYADWWEVLDQNGNLLYRRILAHSHVGEQPFVRSGGSVVIAATDQVIVRAHMNNTGYGRQAYTGSVQDGFKEEILPEDFFLDLDQVAPLPDGCAF